MKVLVVDDSRAMRAYVRGVLKDAGPWTVVEASSGFEALRLLPREAFDLVITDINMPDINGLELVRFIRRSERQGRVPLLIVSTLSSERDRARVLELGADAFLAKPFEPEDLRGAVAGLVPSVSAKDARGDE
ncbi:MAG: response regulator [Deltaproteobacteria bacterium]|nr:response regulator [Deltaproteobacteria bacterium]